MVGEVHIPCVNASWEAPQSLHHLLLTFPWIWSSHLTSSWQPHQPHSQSMWESRSGLDPSWLHLNLTLVSFSGTGTLLAGAASLLCLGGRCHRKVLERFWRLCLGLIGEDFLFTIPKILRVTVEESQVCWTKEAVSHCFPVDSPVLIEHHCTWLHTSVSNLVHRKELV